MNFPLVSIIVAAYNVEAYISECLESILAQDYKCYELIVIDDASTDNTSLILDFFKEKDKRVQVIHNLDNIGLSAVRNKGIDISKGKYILFVDGDDLIAENLLSETVYCAERNNLDEVSFGYKIFTKEQEWDWMKKKGCIDNEISDKLYTGKQMLIMREKMISLSKENIASQCSWSWLYNKDFLKKNNLWFKEKIIHEDNLFWFQCCLYAKRVMMIDKELYFYRKNTGSITTSWHNTRAKSLFVIISYIYAEWINNELLEEEDKAIKSFLSRLWNSYRKAELNGEIGELKINSPIDFMYDLLHGKQSFIFGQLPKKSIDIISKVDNVFVYGAGAAATEVFQQLSMNNIKVKGVMVTNKKGNPKCFGGITVKTLDEWGLIDNSVVVLAITKKYRADIESRLREYGYEYIIKVQDD